MECKRSKDQHVKPRECPELISKEDKELAEKEGWRQCPKKGCQNLISKNGGCRVIECEYGTHFCFDCGGLVRLNERDDPSGYILCACHDSHPEDFIGPADTTNERERSDMEWMDEMERPIHRDLDNGGQNDLHH